jgi:malate dehydrogenase (oxaloacetate-decarboxylating)
MDANNKALDLHRQSRGKIEIMPKVPLSNSDELSEFYTPGVASVSNAIHAEPDKAYEYTSKSNMVAIISDGTRVLGLGNVGPEAAIPVMEGKSAIFKRFGGIDAVPICIDERSEEGIISLVKAISPSFGAINIEDIESPKCFRILERLQKELNIPVFHDDQQGTAAVVLGGIINSLKLSGKSKSSKIVILGAGAAGYGITKLLLVRGFDNIIVVDSRGAIYKGRKEDMTPEKAIMADATNKGMFTGSLDDAMAGADIFIGVSSKGRITKQNINSMAEKPIVFALSNPYPEISYEDAMDAGAFIVATGRSDKPNQVNNLLAFPGIVRGLLETRARAITEKTLLAAAEEIARSVGKNLAADHILPRIGDKGFETSVAPRVAAAVAEATVTQGLSRIRVGREEVLSSAKSAIRRYIRIEARLIKKEFYTKEGSSSKPSKA